MTMPNHPTPLNANDGEPHEILLKHEGNSELYEILDPGKGVRHLSELEAALQSLLERREVEARIDELKRIPRYTIDGEIALTKEGYEARREKLEAELSQRDGEKEE